MVKIDKQFLGTGWSFPPEFHNNAYEPGVKMVSEDEDITESLGILLSTRPGERIMHPSYGCGLHGLLFENIGESSITELKDVIEHAVLFFESRITLERIDVDTTHALDGRLDICLSYTVRKTNTRSNIVYPFYYLEGSQVRI